MSGQGPSTHGTQGQSNVKNGKRITRLTAVFVAMVMVFSCLAIVNGSDDSYAEEQKCGTTVSWQIVGDSLRLTGTGDTTDYSSTTHAPWYDDREDIRGIIIAGGITSLGSYLFADLTNLQTVEYMTSGDYITSIGANCFRNNSSLSTLQLPSSVTTIGSSAFYGCSSLSTLTLPSGLTSLGESAFEASGITEMTLPSGITTVPANCFKDCLGLVTVNLSPSTTVIDLGAFRESSLANIRMPDTVTEIKLYAFYGCYGLGDLHISSALSALGTYAFNNVNFCDLNMSPIDKTVVANLKGKDFYRAGNDHVLIDGSLKQEGGTYSMSADSASIEVHASDVAYISYKAISDPTVTLKFGLKDGASVSFDNTATKAITKAGTMSVTAVDHASLDEKTKDLVGSDPVYDLSFGDNTVFGGGKVTVVLPYILPDGKSAGDLKVHFIKDGKVSETYDCTYADGKVTFTTDHMSLYSIGTDGSSGGGKFPVWAIVIIIFVVLAAAGGAAAFFIMKNRKGGQPTEATRPKPAESPVVATPEPEKVSESIYEAVPAEPELVKEGPVAAPTEVTEPVKEEPVPEPVKEEPAPVEEVPAALVTEDVPAAPAEPVPEAKEEKPPEKKPPVGGIEDDLDPSGSNDW